MIDSLEQLEMRFSVLRETRGTSELPLALADYLLFVEETSPLNTVARRVGRNPHITRLYEKLRGGHRELEDGVAPFPFHEAKNAMPFVAVFHANILDALKSQHSRVIRKNDRGDFFFNSTRIEMPKETLYYKVFDALFTRTKGDGTATFEEIENHVTTSGCVPMGSTKERNKRIHNALSKNGLFRYALVNGKPLRNELPNGEKLIEPARGVGVRLNNPQV